MGSDSFLMNMFGDHVAEEMHNWHERAKHGPQNPLYAWRRVYEARIIELVRVLSVKPEHLKDNGKPVSRERGKAMQLKAALDLHETLHDMVQYVFIAGGMFIKERRIIEMALHNLSEAEAGRPVDMAQYMAERPAKRRHRDVR